MATTFDGDEKGVARQADASVPVSSAGADTAGDAQQRTPHALEDQSAFLPPRQVIFVFLALSMAIFLAFLDQTIIAAALPRISADLHSGKESSWVATSYMLTSLAVIPIYGRWSDVFGRKPVLLVAMSIFAVASLACALARTMIQLIVFRAFQGIGGGGLITMALVIVSDIVSLRDRGKYMGIIDIVVVVSGCMGSFLGGVFSQYTTWRWAFWINLPLCAISLAVSIWLLPLKGVSGNIREKLARIDYTGSALTVVSSVLILLGLNWGGVSFAWNSAAVIVPFVVGALLFALFLVWEGRYAQLPIVPLTIFRYPTVVGMCICMFMNGMTMYIMMYFMITFLQIVRGETFIRASILLLAFLAPISAFVYVAGQITTSTGNYRWIIITGQALWCLAQGLLSRVDLQSSDAYIIGVLFMSGAVIGLVMQTGLLAAQAAVPRQEMAVVTGVRNFVRLFGSTIGLAVAGAIVNNALRHGVEPLGLPENTVSRLLDDPTIINDDAFRSSLGDSQHLGIILAYLDGFRAVFLMTVGCQAVSTLSAFCLIRQHELNREDDTKLKDEGRAVLDKFKVTKRRQEDIERGEASFPSEHKDDGIPRDASLDNASTSDSAPAVDGPTHVTPR